MYPKKRIIVLLLLFTYSWARADTGVDDKTITSPLFKVEAKIVKGCVLGSGATSVASFGTIDFGGISSVAQNKDVISSSGAGSIIIRCTKNVSVTVALNNGVNASGSISGGRFLKNADTNETLRYQLYQDSGFSNIWGSGSNGGAVRTVVADGSIQTYPIYARLFSTTTLPSVGIYTDSIIVTVSY